MSTRPHQIYQMTSTLSTKQLKTVDRWINIRKGRIQL